MIFALSMIAIIASFFINADSFLKGLLKFGLLGGGVYFAIMSAVTAIIHALPAAKVY